VPPVNRAHSSAFKILSFFLEPLYRCSSQARQINTRAILLVLDLLRNRLATNDSRCLRIVSEHGRAIQLPPVIETFRDSVAEAGIIRTCQKAIKVHGKSSLAGC
jgi:hypothetical protein